MRADSRRRSTRPAVSWARAGAGTLIRRSASSLAPAAFPAARSPASAVWYATAPCGGDHPDGDARGSGAEGRQDGRRPGQVEAGAEQRPDGGRLDDNGGVARIGRERPEHEQVACGEPARRRAPRTSPDRRTPSRPGLPAGRPRRPPRPRTAASWRAGAALAGLLARVPVRCLTATTASDPMTRAGITIRAASPAPSQLADSGSASGGSRRRAAAAGRRRGCLRAVGAGRDPEPFGDLVLGERARRWRRAGWAACRVRQLRIRSPRASGRPGSPRLLSLLTEGVVTSPAAACPVHGRPPSDRSAVTAASRRCRSSADSQRRGRRAGRGRAARGAPRKRCGSSLPRPSSAMPVNPLAGRMPDDANRTV